jgi:hypothetical protein
LACLLALPAGALAQATRTWVSGNSGNDANPCSSTAPCKTFAGAISKTAAGGEINVLDSGGYGAVTITKSITISATGATGGVLVSGTNGIVVAAGDSDTVTLRGLDIDGVLTGLSGVKVTHAKDVRLEDDEIYGFNTTGAAVDFQPTAPTPGSGITPTLSIENTLIHDNTGPAVRVVPPAGTSVRAVVTNSTIENNGCGLVVGLAVATFDTAGCGTDRTVTSGGTAEIDSTNSSISNNTGVGLLADGATSTQAFTGDTIFGNGVGLSALNGGRLISIGANTVFGNTANGAPTSTESTGGSGATGPAGPQGARGQAGEVELVTCKTVTVTTTKKVHGKKKKVKRHVQKCVGKLVSGKVKFTVTGKLVKATLSRNGRIYASGDLVAERGGTAGALTLRRRLTRGRYTLTMSRGGKVLSRATVRND